ncbi:MAG: hypothetical protein ACO3F3_17490 [Gemmataceae bacterium]
MESTCLNLDGCIESFPEISFENQSDVVSIFWEKRPEIYWRLVYSLKEDKETLDSIVYLQLLGPFPTAESFEKRLKFNSPKKDKSFNGRNALGRLIKFIKNFDYGISS